MEDLLRILYFKQSLINCHNQIFYRKVFIKTLLMGGVADTCYNPENNIVNYYNNKSEIVTTKVSFSTGDGETERPAKPSWWYEIIEGLPSPIVKESLIDV